jgi:DNA-binding NarL/FixJ family response regulator
MVLDIQLGGMSGLELQRKLKASGSRVPVIVMTAFDDVHIREEAIRIGCLGYLDKAADLDVLVDLIRSV